MFLHGGKKKPWLKTPGSHDGVSQPNVWSRLPSPCHWGRLVSNLSGTHSSRSSILLAQGSFSSRNAMEEDEGLCKTEIYALKVFSFGDFKTTLRQPCPGFVFKILRHSGVQVHVHRVSVWHSCSIGLPRFGVWDSKRTCEVERMEFPGLYFQ